jgi:hypothetical protein
MLAKEARWIGHALAPIETHELTPVLNVGSATSAFREQVQPWIEREIFAPLRARGVQVEHTDIQHGAGVDLVGDLSDNSFVNRLAARRYRSLLCCNLLEHVDKPAEVATKLQSLVMAGGFLVVTVPRSFPYHPDPIDTMFRPDAAQLSQLFPGCRLVEATILNCGTGWDYVDRNPMVLLSKIKRRLSTRKDHGGMSGTTSFLPWLFRTFKQTCVLLQKNS